MSVSMIDVTPTQLELEEVGGTPAAKQAVGVDVAMQDVSYSVMVKKEPLKILDGITGIFKAGRMTALMGPSGSGKTTLLDVCSGRKNSGRVTGTVAFAGNKSVRKSVLKDLCGYVEQFDTLVGELTVKDMLMYTAELRLATNMSKAEKLARVEQILVTLGLEKCANTVIGNVLQRGISGGQAKRVNIGLALISSPGVIFLDEPTSGLDSFMANEVACTLQALARAGRTIVCTIHSPTAVAFSKFDDLYILKGGKTVFGGPVSGGLGYFTDTCGIAKPNVSGTSFCLPEWLVETISVDQDGVDLVAMYAGSDLAASAANACEESLAAADKLDVGGSAYRPGAFKQLATLLQYRTSTHYKSGEFLGPRIGDKVMFGLLILSLYWGIGDKEDTNSIASTSALLYFISALCGYGAAAFVPSLTLDRPLFYRELADGCYSPLVYYLSKFFEEALLCIATTLLFSVIVFWGVNLQGSFWIFVVNYYLTTMTGICLAYAVAALVPTMDAANALLPTYVTTCLYFGGLFITFDKIPEGWYWFSWTSFLRYSWGAQMLNQYQNSSVGQYGGFYDTSYKNQTECITATLPSIVYQAGVPTIAYQPTEVCRHDIEGKVVTVLEFYGMGKEGELMGSMGGCVAMSAALTLLFAACGACAVSFVRFNKR